MDKKQMEKDLRGMSGDQIFEQHSVTAKRIKRYKELLRIDEARLEILTDILYNGKQIEEDDDDGNEDTTI